MPSNYRMRCFLIVVLLAVVWVLPWPAGAQQTPAPPAAPKDVGQISFQDLQKTLEITITQLQKNIKTWESKVADSATGLAQSQDNLKKLQVSVAFVKATMALEKPSLLRLPGYMVEYADQEQEVKKKLNSLGQEIKAFKKAQQDHLELQNILRMQLSIIAAKTEGLPPELQQYFLDYLKLAGKRDGLVARALDQKERRRQLLQQELDLLTGLASQLKKLESAWKPQLLNRPAAAVPLGQQISQTLNNISSVPQQAWDWFQSVMNSGRLGSFLWLHLAPILGLIVLIILLGWSTRRLNNLVTRRFENWKSRTEYYHLLPLYVMGKTLIANLFWLVLILWLALFFWNFSLLELDPIQIILLALLTLWGLRICLRWVQDFFAGKEGGVLPLEPDVAKFYRRSLKVFLVYLLVGILTLKSASLLDTPEITLLFLTQVFLTGILVCGLWLLRPHYLKRLLPELSDPTWLHHPVVALALRGLLVALVVIIILADLLGFQNLSLYLANAAAWTLLASWFLWLLWLIGETIIRHLLHPQEGRTAQLFPEKADLVHRVYVLSRWVLALLLGTLVGLWVLHFWGISPPQVASAFRWMTWGPILGPVKLNSVTVIGVILALYLGFFLSRLVRGLMMIRIFPHTALDTGVQYTISMTIHYVILIIAAIIALNILGFPLTNLALVLGALGVGIGFGLQNIVNNFFSGLILLFERPIKVGDMLVIDGQWGLVKEIRVRSTIFETFDRYTLIIPNSDLVSNKVLNWTRHGPTINRLTLKVGVSYGSDVRQVTQLITEICQANPRVVPEPPPQIFFNAYGDSSLDFTIWVHLHTPSDRIPATHELNTAIFEGFNEHGIEIPFPQRDLHVKQWPPPEKGKESHSPPAPLPQLKEP